MTRRTRNLTKPNADGYQRADAFWPTVIFFAIVAYAVWGWVVPA